MGSISICSTEAPGGTTVTSFFALPAQAPSSTSGSTQSRLVIRAPSLVSGTTGPRARFHRDCPIGGLPPRLTFAVYRLRPLGHGGGRADLATPGAHFRRPDRQARRRVGPGDRQPPAAGPADRGGGPA